MQTVDEQEILILGGGFGGLAVAQSLSGHISPRFKPRITLVDRNSFHQFVPLWHEVAAATLDPVDVTVPFSRLLDEKKVRLLQANVTGFDFPNKTVHTSDGELHYNILVIALGSQANYFGIPSLEQYSLSISSLTQAMNIRQAIESHFREASELPIGNPDRALLLTFVVGGGGFTGVEVAGQLADWLPELSLAYGIPAGEVRLLIAEGSPQLLKGLDEQLVKASEEILCQKGVELKLGQPCAEARPDGIVLKSGEEIPTRALIWTGGVRANDLVGSSGLKTGANSRIVVSPFCESVDFDNVYLVGDNALVIDPHTNRPMAPSAQLAIQQGKYIARNIWREAIGLPRRKYVPHISSQAVSLGRRSAVAHLWGLRLVGMDAAILKQLSLVRYAFSIGGIELALEKTQDFMPLGRWLERRPSNYLYGELIGETCEQIARDNIPKVPGM